MNPRFKVGNKVYYPTIPEYTLLITYVGVDHYGYISTTGSVVELGLIKPIDSYCELVYPDNLLNSKLGRVLHDS